MGRNSLFLPTCHEQGAILEVNHVEYQSARTGAGVTRAAFLLCHNANPSNYYSQFDDIFVILYLLLQLKILHTFRSYSFISLKYKQWQ